MSWSRTQVQGSPALCFHGNRPGLSTAVQQQTHANLGEIIREGAQQQEETATLQKPAGLGIHRK